MSQRKNSEAGAHGPFQDAGEAAEPSHGIRGFVRKLGFSDSSAIVPLVEDATGLPVDGDAPQRRRTVRAIGDAAGEIVGSFEKVASSGETVDGEAILAAWPEVAGDLAERVTPERLVAGVLFAKVASSAELFEIQRFKVRGLLKAARSHPAFAGLRQIKLRVHNA